MASNSAISQEIQERRDFVFLFLAGFFLCAMTLLNVIGITKFVQLGPMALAVGVLPYPLTFLCTDLVCELYGRKRANQMVTVGLVLNFFILGTLWLGNTLPGAGTPAPWQLLHLSQDLPMPPSLPLINSAVTFQGSAELFEVIYRVTSGAVFASMLAYVAAQYIDIRLFHFWKRLTKGRHLWLRNNFSTLVSQAVDSVMVVSITFGAMLWAGDMALNAFLVLIASNYVFKMASALIDTPFFYFFTWKLRAYLQLEPDADSQS